MRKNDSVSVGWAMGTLRAIVETWREMCLAGAADRGRAEAELHAALQEQLDDAMTLFDLVPGDPVGVTNTLRPGVLLAD